MLGGEIEGEMPKIKKGLNFLKPLLALMWAHLGSNQGPPDYESGALTNWAIGPATYVDGLQI